MGSRLRAQGAGLAHGSGTQASGQTFDGELGTLGPCAGQNRWEIVRLNTTEGKEQESKEQKSKEK